MGRSLNFAFGSDRTEGLYDAQTRKRLADVKAAYDPANLFRRNCNVRRAPVARTTCWRTSRRWAARPSPGPPSPRRR
ncbi:BBE domain-containing protein [Streptomyces sp. NBC_01003]|uniref:BBE domain-containing protein n=1 Tax=Streptomyces sp. NBC_01003 TaxID=2903714 RepID=UPI00386893B8